MEALEQNIAQIIINNKDVTADVTPYLSRLNYTDKIEAESDDVTLVFEDKAGYWRHGWYPEQGDSLTVIIGSPGSPLDCGVFEIDTIELEYPPDTVTVKAIAASITKALRSKNSKSFEKQSLYQIAKYFADKHGLRLTGNVTELQKIEIERKTQERQTDISFLAGLAREYDIVFSVRGDRLVFIDTDELDAQPAILTLHKNAISKARFTDKTSYIYEGATVSARNMKDNSVRRFKVNPSDKDGGKGTLSVSAENEPQAEAKAKASVKKEKREKITGGITLAGNVRLVAGVNIELLDIGKLSGKWHVVSSSHSIDGSGYITDASIRKIEV